MDFEEKGFYVGTVDKKAGIMSLRKTFGWEYVEDYHQSRGGYHIKMRRDKNMPNYSQLVSLERQYDSLNNQRKGYTTIMEEPAYFLLILCLVIPFIVYVFIKIAQKKNVEEHNAEIERQKSEILRKARALR